jgi:predicted transcriptional regulator
MRSSGTKKPTALLSEGERAWKRLRENRPMTSISIRIPEDVIEDLKEIAPALGYSGYQPLIRAYIGRGLRKDLERLDRSPGKALAESLRKRGMSDSAIAEVIAEAKVG